MNRTALAVVIAALGLSSCAHGQPAGEAAAPNGAAAIDAGPASAAFCLFEVPGSGGSRRLVNLGIVQYVELAAGELRIYYGGGNLGSGYEARFALKGPDEGRELIARMQKAAQDCSRQPAAPPAAPAGQTQ